MLYIIVRLVAMIRFEHFLFGVFTKILDVNINTD